MTASPMTEPTRQVRMSSSVFFQTIAPAGTPAGESRIVLYVPDTFDPEVHLPERLRPLADYARYYQSQAVDTSRLLLTAFGLLDPGLNLAAARVTQTRIDLSNLVQQAVLNIQNAQERLDASRVAAEAAARNLEAENARYQQGLAIPVDLTTAQLNSFTAQSNEIQALYDYYVAQAQLKQALGQ